MDDYAPEPDDNRPHRTDGPGEPERIDDVTGVILAGGAARRFGSDKLKYNFGGRPLVLVTAACLGQVFSRLLAVTDRPEIFADLPEGIPPVETTPDAMVCSARNAMVGVYTGLVRASTEWIFAVAGDMPFLQPPLIRYLTGSARDTFDMVIPMHGTDDELQEPLCALYHRRCIPHLEELLRAERYSFLTLVPRVRVATVREPDLRRFDPDLRSFFNINRREDVRKAELLHLLHT